AGRAGGHHGGGGEGGAVRGEPEVGRVLPQQPGGERDDGQGGTGHDERGHPPAVPGGQVRQHRQEDELAGGATGGEYPGDQPTVPDEPAGGHGRHEGQGHRA